MPEQRTVLSRARKALLITSLAVFVAANIVFPKYLPDTPALGYTHLAVIALSGGIAVWLLLTRGRS
jgi:hypothetical protein